MESTGASSPSPSPADWAEFFALYRGLAVRVARGITGDDEAAEDAAQEAARALVERGVASFQSREHARNWYLRTVKNLSVSTLRRRGRAREVALEGEEAAKNAESNPYAAAIGRETAEALAALGDQVDALVNGLLDGEREAVLLRYREGLAYREMAARTGRAISTLQARVEAGLKKIRTTLGKGSAGANGQREDLKRLTDQDHMEDF